jgi:hypothetical protein
MTDQLAGTRQVQTRSGRGALPLLVVGGVCGLAWTASLRGVLVPGLLDPATMFSGGVGGGAILGPGQQQRPAVAGSCCQRACSGDGWAGGPSSRELG